MLSCHLENEKPNVKSLELASGHTIYWWLYGNSKLYIFTDGEKQSYRTILKTHLGGFLWPACCIIFPSSSFVESEGMEVETKQEETLQI